MTSEVEVSPPDRIGVVGAGIMGSGIAQDLAAHGFEVDLVDSDRARLERIEAVIRDGLRTQRLFARGGPPPPAADEVVARIHLHHEVAGVAGCDFVIENVTERWEVKREVYRQLDRLCPPSSVFGANTSAISITRLGAVTGRPDRVVGMHFMNPAPLKPVVELVRGHHTSEPTLARARALLAALGKEGIQVEDMPGFVSNRVLMLTINEAIFLVQDRVAAPEDVDRIFKTCFGHKMGPLETGDLIGLDTILLSLEVLYESFNDTKFRPSPLLRKMVDAGLLGRKSGTGFYRYEPEAG